MSTYIFAGLTIVQHVGVQSAEENWCFQCNGAYEDDTVERQSSWIGCSSCWRRAHYDCAGFSSMPAEWYCDMCQ